MEMGSAKLFSACSCCSTQLPRGSSWFEVSAAVFMGISMRHGGNRKGMPDKDGDGGAGCTKASSASNEGVFVVNCFNMQLGAGRSMRRRWAEMCGFASVYPH